MMSPREIEAAENAIALLRSAHDMAPLDRSIALALSVVAEDPNPFYAIAGLINTAKQMGCMLDDIERLVIARTMLNAARRNCSRARVTR